MERKPLSKLIIVLPLFLGNYFLPFYDERANLINNHPFGVDEIKLISGVNCPEISVTTLKKLKRILHKEATTLDPRVINAALVTLKCATLQHTLKNNILVIIDYSLPSNEKRLWVFDLNANKLLFHTYVSHGIRSGTLLSKYFSNNFNSKASSIGIFNADKIYYGRHGPSLRLEGLERNFNDNANSRAIVMHGAWYVDENFIKKYGRAGRSWGCPAIPSDHVKQIINTIQNGSLFVVYYPNNNWFSKSNFLNCDRNFLKQNINPFEKSINFSISDDELHEGILFADKNNNSKHIDSDPVPVMTADDYQRIFNKNAPLSRMLRRQINNAEYIVLTDSDLKTISTSNNIINLNSIFFVVPEVKMSHGYYGTEFKFIPMGKIKEIKSNLDVAGKNPAPSYTIYFEEKSPINLRFTSHFIRWIGL